MIFHKMLYKIKTFHTPLQSITKFPIFFTLTSLTEILIVTLVLKFISEVVLPQFESQNTPRSKLTKDQNYLNHALRER